MYIYSITWDFSNIFLFICVVTTYTSRVVAYITIYK